MTEYIRTVQFETDALELGSRTAFWFAAASDDPWFMLARHRLHEQPPKRRVHPVKGPRSA